MTYDVLVVGAGPAGSSAAERLARSGWRVGLLEEHPQIGHPVNCSGVIGTEVFERFALPSSLIRHTLDAVSFHSPGGLRWSFEARRPLAHAVDRTDLDRLLAERARRAGAEILLEHRVVGIDPDEKGLRVRVDGAVSPTLEARAVILATGAGVPLLKRLGWGDAPRKLLGVQTEIDLEAESVEIHLGRAWAPEGFGWIIPLGGGRAKVGLLSDRRGPEHLRRFLARPDVRRRTLGPPGPILCSVIPLGFLPRSYADRVLVAGEAAGHIKATTCGGIYYSMLTAGVAAEVLDEALAEDRLGAERLARYETRWRGLLEDEIRVGLRLRRAFYLLSDPGLDRLVSLAQRDGILNLIHEKAHFDWHRDLIRAVFRHAMVGRILGAA